jgi:hypothetical protein
MPSAIAAPNSIILPFGNFGEDYGISAGSSMEKWQSGAEIEKYWVLDATVNLPSVVPAEAGTQVLLELSKRVELGFPPSRE